MGIHYCHLTRAVKMYLIEARLGEVMYNKIFIILLITGTMLFAQPPVFKNAGHVTYLEEELYNKHGTNLAVADWNGNGLRDLVLGFNYEGQIRFDPNSSSSSPHFFQPFETLYADGEMIYFSR